MNAKQHKNVIWMALLMGLLTILFCLVLADGVLGINGLRVDNGDGTGIVYSNNKIGAVVFWVFIIALPLLFAKWVRWRHTITNLFLYFVLYFPVNLGFRSSVSHVFLEQSGFISWPTWFYAVYTAVIFWGVQSIVYLVYNIIRYFIRKGKNA